MNIHQANPSSRHGVHSIKDAPEVELVNMLEDQLPQYKLQVDSLYIYDDQDLIQSQAHQSNVLCNLSPVLAEDPFRYTISGSERVEQLSRSYDSDMLSHLLTERDRDLELAARIGQALLKRNHNLSEQNESLEEQLTQALDHVNQLQHELSKKEDLLRVVSIASEESETDSSCSTPLRSNDSFTISHSLMQLENLNGKLRELEEENFSLRSKASHLKTETITYEEKEQQLVIDCVKEIRESSVHISKLTEELASKSEENVRYQEEISTVLSQVVDLQHKLRESAIEKEELRIHLQASKEAQRQLTAELHELQDRNAEIQGMLQENQEELKMMRCKASPSALLRRPQSCSIFPVDSLAAEIEGTMRKEYSMDEESSYGVRKSQPKRVFDTVKVANEVRGRSSSYPLPLPIPGSNHSGVVMTAVPFGSNMTEEKKKSKAILFQEDAEENKLAKNPPKPEVLGNSLEVALHRLHLRRQNYISEKQFFRDECERKLKLLEDEEDNSGCSTPTNSVLSVETHHSDVTDGSASSSSLRSLLPEKLQIVKPLEGSQTLFHWQQLAQPNLGTILDPRPGVMTKDFKPLPEDAEYHLCDLEEDEKDDEEEEGGIIFQVQKREEDVPNNTLSIFLPPVAASPSSSSAINPGKLQGCTNSTFTFTTCRIMHPSDITQVTPSSMYTPLSFGGSSTCTTSTFVGSHTTTCRLSVGEAINKRCDSTSTFSSTSNLTRLLQEQGISAKLDKPLDGEKPQPLRPNNLALPSTPPNSPSNSPSPLTSEAQENPSESFLAVSRPAESFLQEMYGFKLSKKQPDVGQQKMNLVDRLKRLGIARVVNQAATGDTEPNSALCNGLRRHESAVFIGTSSSLLSGLRRNQSLPTLIGGLVPPVCTSSPKMDSLKED
ncbi:trafficking kinesin-binding protein 2 isoform X2 [Xenopus laevis]|uniref:Trafficking kinesin-binding protein 2 n=2 Tax=Xenopus laevis TaxID=8355 RepID=A0A974BZP3_XENLA|nr:trafficking kinesin-binding protein 2 isoform X2 [Xenopus laevis]OCT63817.1 hypothetical protein XELAEV_18044914mg [Xenopus laevis]